MSAAAAPRVSVVIVTYNSAADIADCLRALPAAATRTSYEVVIVDNASNDDSVAVVRREVPGAVVIEQRQNTGFAEGCNTGVRAASGTYVLLLNPDAVPQPGCIDALLAFADEHPDRTPLGGRCVDDAGGLDPRSCWGAPTLWSTACFATGLARLRPSSPRLNPEGMGGWRRDDVREVGVVTGFLLLVQRDVWHQLGGLDPTFFVYGEDVDFSVRAREAGRRPTITPDAVVVHAAGASSSDSLSKLLLLYKGKATFMIKHWAGWRQHLGRSLLVLGVGVRALASADGSDYGRLWRARADWRHGFS